jgi:HAD superfamily hydrolase (TIGR01484 family)
MVFTKRFLLKRGYCCNYRCKHCPYKMKKLLIFDLDGTLAESKCALSLDMAELLEEALQHYSIAVISGGNYPQFEKQFLGYLPLLDAQLQKLYLFPTCATSFYRYNKRWEKVYSEDLSLEQRQKILGAFQEVFKEVGFVPGTEYGPVLEDRLTQITFSALGQEAPVHLKKKWDPHHIKRLSMIDVLKNKIPEFEIRTGGSTSIDVTNKDIDKAYGIKQIEKHLGFQKSDMIFIGDALFDGGNDAPVKRTGVECLEVNGPEDTKKIIRQLIANSK